MSNANARYIMGLLGIGFDCADSMPAAEFAERLDFAMIVGGGDTGTVPVAYVDESVWGGATVIDCGRPAGYADERLEQLREVADWALAHGREVLWS
jgi:glyoxylase-like metal-dependent hydrolase (beta-lactamase superfamily II)